MDLVNAIMSAYYTPIRRNNHIQMLKRKQSAYPDDAPASQHWKVIKATSLSHLQTEVLRITCARLCDPQSEVPCAYISTPVKTSLWRTFHLTGLIFRQRHLLLSTPLLGFLSPLLKNITVNTSSISPCSLPLL